MRALTRISKLLIARTNRNWLDACSGVHKAILGTIHVIKSVVKHQTDMFNTHWAIMWWFYNVFMQLFYNVFKQPIGNEIIERVSCKTSLHQQMGARRNFFRGRQHHVGWQQWPIFRRACAEAATENTRVFFTETACDIIIFKFQRGQLPLPPSAYGPTRLISNIPRA